VAFILSNGNEMRNRSLTIQIVCALLFVISFTLPVDLPAAERATIATPSRGLFEFPVVVAMRKGFFKDEGIDVQKVQMAPTLGVQALVAGS